jgi:hypothetical protein
MKRVIEFTLGGEVFRLVPDFAAMSILEEGIKSSLYDFALELNTSRPRLSHVVKAIYAGVLAGGEKKWTAKSLGDFLIQNRFHLEQQVHDAVVDFMGELLAAGSDQDEEKKKDGEEQPSPSTSTSLPLKSTE